MSIVTEEEEVRALQQRLEQQRRQRQDALDNDGPEMPRQRMPLHQSNGQPLPPQHAPGRAHDVPTGPLHQGGGTPPQQRPGPPMHQSAGPARQSSEQSMHQGNGQPQQRAPEVQRPAQQTPMAPAPQQRPMQPAPRQDAPQGRVQAPQGRMAPTAPRVSPNRDLWRKPRSIPAILLQPADDDIIFVEDGTGDVSRRFLEDTFPYLARFAGFLGFADSVWTTIYCVLQAERLLRDGQWSYIGVVVGVAIAMFLTVIQIYCSNKTTHKKILSYYTALAIDATMTWWWWITILLTFVSAIAAARPGMLLWIAVAELAAVLGFAAYKVLKTIVEQVNDIAFWLIAIVSGVVSFIVMRLLFHSTLQETDAQVYWTAFGIATFVSVLSSWLPEHILFGNQMRKRKRSIPGA